MDYEKIGEKRIINGETYYCQGCSGEGYVFKDEDAFCNRPNDVCYIPEYAFSDLESIEIEGKDFYKGEELDVFTRHELEKMLVTDDGEPYKDEDEDYVSVEYFFNSLTWTYPFTWLMENAY